MNQKEDDERILRLEKPGYVAEWGSAVRFVPGRLVSENGIEVLCDCGEPASEIILGKESFAARCYKCSCGPDESRAVCRPRKLSEEPPFGVTWNLNLGN